MNRATGQSTQIRVAHTGGPGMLLPTRQKIPAAEPGHALVRNTAIGVNYIDVYHRNGTYGRPTPFVPGVEGAGIVVSAPDPDAGSRPGDRVGYIGMFGAYADHALVPVDRLIPIPDDIDDVTAAASLLQGITAYVLLHEVYRVRPGDTILVHAAAGGLGLLMCQWASALGATVVGTVSSSDKAVTAAANGCSHPLLSGSQQWPETVRELTGGVGVPVVFDSIGRATFAGSLDCLGVRGLLVSVGQSSGSPDPLDVPSLGGRGSLTVTRPSVFHYVPDRASLLHAAEAVFDAIRRRQLHIEAKHLFALADANIAHTELEARLTSGPLVLTP